MTISNATLPGLADPGQITQSPLTGYELVQVDAGPEFTNNTVAGIADTALFDQTVTATGSSRAGAYVLVAQKTNVTTAAASTGVVLPTATKPGMTRLVFNNGANPLTVYALGSDTIDGTAGSTGVILQPATSAFFNCAATGKWLSIADSGAAGAAAVFTSVTLEGATSGSTVLQASATAAGTLTAPPVTGTVASTSGSNLFVTDVYRTSAPVTVNNSATYVTVTGLSGAVVIGTYRFRCVLPSTVASGTGGIKYSFHYTNSAALSALEATGLGYTAAAVAVQHTTTTTDVTDMFTQAAVVIMTVIEGTFVVSTGGTITVQMAQNTANGSNTVALLGGSFELCRIA